MKKEMKKKEILERLQELDRLLKLSHEDLFAEMNEMFPDHQMKDEEYYPHMVGWIESEIEFILNGGF